MAGNRLSSTDDPLLPLVRWLWGTVAITIATFLASLALLPWRLIGLPLAVAGVVVGGITSLKAFRTPGTGILKLGAPMATISCAFFSIMLAGQALFLGPSLEYQNCQAGSLTLRSEQICKKNLQNHILPTSNRRIS